MHRYQKLDSTGRRANHTKSKTRSVGGADREIGITAFSGVHKALRLSVVSDIRLGEVKFRPLSLAKSKNRCRVGIE